LVAIQIKDSGISGEQQFQGHEFGYGVHVKAFRRVNRQASQSTFGDQLLDSVFDEPRHCVPIVARQPQTAQPPTHHAVDCVAGTRIAPEILLETGAYRFNVFRFVHIRLVGNVETASSDNSIARLLHAIEFAPHRLN